MSDRITIENVRVGRDGVELKQSAAGKEYAQFTAMWSSSRKNRQSGEMEYGPTKFLTVRVFGFKAGDVAANINAGDRVNVSGNLDHFEWMSQDGPRDDWSLFADSVSLPVPRAGMHERVNNQPGGPSGGSAGDPWNSGPQGGFGGAQSNEEPPF